MCLASQKLNVYSLVVLPHLAVPGLGLHLVVLLIRKTAKIKKYKHEHVLLLQTAMHKSNYRTRLQLQKIYTTQSRNVTS